MKTYLSKWFHPGAGVPLLRSNGRLGVAASIAIISMVAACTSQSHARRTLVPHTRNVEFLETGCDSLSASDTVCTAGTVTRLPEFDENAVTLRGFNKRATDNYETFFVRNNLQFCIAGITVILRYTDMDGALLHERTLHVPCELQPGKSRQVSINSFDRQRIFYYYLSGKPRKSATPFKVSARLMGYDITISRPGR